MERLMCIRNVEPKTAGEAMRVIEEKGLYIHMIKNVSYRKNIEWRIYRESGYY